MYFLSSSECVLATGSSIFFSQRNVPATINTGVALRPGHAHHRTHIPATLHTTSSHQLAPATDQHTTECEDINTLQRFSLVNTHSHIWINQLRIYIQGPWSCCISCTSGSFRPCLRSSTGCSWLLFTCFCFHSVCLIHWMNGCHGDSCLG